MGQLPAHVCACSRSAPVRTKQPSQNQHPIQARAGNDVCLVAAERLSLAILFCMVELQQFLDDLILCEVPQACGRSSCSSPFLVL